MITGCTNLNPKQESKSTGNIDQLSVFFPQKPSQWYYQGTGTYELFLETDQMIYGDRRIDYKLKGEVRTKEKDVSYNDLTVAIRYVLTNKGLRQEIKGHYLMDSAFKNLYLIQFPIKPGNFWYEDVIDFKGNDYQVKTEIIDESFIDDQRILTLRTEDLRSDYYEVRKIKENTGVIAFEKSENINGSYFKMGYTLDYMETLIKSLQDVSEGYAISFLNRYNKAWENYYNKGDEAFFQLFLKPQSAKEKYENFNKHKNTTVSFQSLEILSFTVGEDHVLVEVKEVFDIYKEGIKSSQSLIRSYHIALDDKNMLKINHIDD